MSVGCSPGPTFSDPLNIMCSNKCAKPVRPARSSADPTLYVTATLNVGAEGSSAMRTRNPFLSFVSVNWTDGPVAAPRQTAAATSAPESRLNLRMIAPFRCRQESDVTAGGTVVQWGLDFGPSEIERHTGGPHGAAVRGAEAVEQARGARAVAEVDERVAIIAVDADVPPREQLGAEARVIAPLSG